MNYTEYEITQKEQLKLLELIRKMPVKIPTSTSNQFELGFNQAVENIISLITKRWMNASHNLKPSDVFSIQIAPSALAILEEQGEAELNIGGNFYKVTKVEKK